ncbi:MAG: hypothetical protein C4523_02310 [Myxococcales bacterium]|nr:MAG: hypothetical protein C4523_02310 [Myxococcales bacterium]
MARKKDVKPLFAVKHDFVDSLDAFVQEVIMFRGAVSNVLVTGGVSGDAAKTLREAIAALDKTMMSE